MIWLSKTHNIKPDEYGLDDRYQPQYDSVRRSHHSREKNGYGFSRTNNNSLKDTLDILVFGNDAWPIAIKDLPYLKSGTFSLIQWLVYNLRWIYCGENAIPTSKFYDY
jgi:hypothetical protein